MSNTCVLENMKYPYKISLYKNGNNINIYYYFRWKGMKYQGSTGSDNLDTSRNKVIEIFFEITKGLRQRGRKKITKLEDIIKSFLKFKTEKGISPKTLVEYKRQSKYILEWFRKQSKGRDINLFFSKNKYKDYCDWRRNYYEDHEKVQTYRRNGKKIEGRMFLNVGNSSLNRECRLLCSVLRHGKEHMGIFNDIQIPSYQMFDEQRRDVILEHDEYENLKKYWMEKNPYYWDIISFLNNTGLRPGELNRITNSDIHLDENYVLIRDRKNKNKSKPINTPVPLVGTSKEIIERLISREGIPKEDNDPVFVNDKGRQIKSISKQFKKSVKSEIGKDMTLYSLRHLFTTRMVRRPDIPLKVLSEVLGHTSTDMINKYYSHLKTEDIVNIFQRSEDHKQEILEKREQEKQNQTEQTST